MNISLSKGSKSKGGSISYGLNNRTGKSTGDPSGGGGAGSKNVFDNDSDDDGSDDDDDGNVNKQIAREQAAARRRAQAALQSMDDPSIYDYDRAYESFNDQNRSKDNGGDVQSAQAKSEPKKSKYIQDLLKSAKVREREREAIYERKVAREQAEEDAQEEYQGKEKFVTKAYKRKLEERKRWDTEQEEKQREEEANDVTKKSANAAFASFYSNLNQVQRGADNDDDVTKNAATTSHEEDFDPRKSGGGMGMGFLGGFESAGEEAHRSQKVRDQDAVDAGQEKKSKRPESGVIIDTAATVRQRRAKKVVEARMRYFQRREIAHSSCIDR